MPTSGVTALQAIRDWAWVGPGQRVLIDGASGGLGSFAVQLAKTVGAEVTAVCGPANAGFVRSIGADHVIDYTREDFTCGSARYDVILDVPHLAHHSLAALRRVLTRDGTLVPSANTPNRVIGGFSRVMPARAISPLVRQRISAPQAAQRQADLAALAELAVSGQVTSIVSRTYPLAEAPEAMRQFVRGHTRGRLVITMWANRREGFSYEVKPPARHGPAGSASARLRRSAIFRSRVRRDAHCRVPAMLMRGRQPLRAFAPLGPMARPGCPSGYDGGHQVGRSCAVVLADFPGCIPLVTVSPRMTWRPGDHLPCVRPGG